MTDIEKDDVVVIAPELAGTALVDDAWERILAYVNQISLTSYDSDEDRALARIYLAAHLASSSIASTIGAAGPVISESVGGVRRAYGLVAMSSGTALGTTKYGRHYELIVNTSNCAGPFLV